MGSIGTLACNGWGHGDANGMGMINCNGDILDCLDSFGGKCGDGDGSGHVHGYGLIDCTGPGFGYWFGWGMGNIDYSGFDSNTDAGCEKLACEEILKDV